LAGRPARSCLATRPPRLSLPWRASGRRGEHLTGQAGQAMLNNYNIMKGIVDLWSSGYRDIKAQDSRMGQIASETPKRAMKK